jgi:hypothetical protein
LPCDPAASALQHGPKGTRRIRRTRRTRMRGRNRRRRKTRKTRRIRIRHVMLSVTVFLKGSCMRE